MNRFIPGLRVYRNADGGASGGTTTAGAPATVTATTGGTSAAATVSTASTMGDAGAASQQQNSATATVPAGVGGQSTTQQTTAAPDFKASLGELGADPSLADFKDTAALAKAYVDTKKLVGQKLGIPGPDATPEAKAAFEAAMGVPPTAEGYDFKKPESLPEGMDYDEKDAAAWATKMKELGIPKDKANALRDAFIKQSVESFKAISTAAKEDSTKTDANFDARATKVFGDKKLEAIQGTRTMLEKYVSKETADLMKDVPNDHLIAFAEFASNFSKEMTGEDIVLKSDSGSTAQSEGDMRTELRRIMALPEYSNPFAKGRQAHQDLQDQARALSAKIAAAQAAAQKRK
jgi:hypothetical protein